MSRIVGGVRRVRPNKKYNSYVKIDFMRAIGKDVVYTVRRSTAKDFVFIRELIDSSKAVDFNTAENRFMLLSLVQAGLIELARAEEIMGAPHEVE